MRIALCKANAHKAGIAQILGKPEGVRFYLHRKEGIHPDAVLQMMEESKGKIKYVSGEEACFVYKYKANSQIPVRTNYARAQTKVVSAKGKVTQEIFQIIEDTIQMIGGIYEKE